MSADRDSLLNWIEQDRDRLVSFLSRFLQAPSPNPPGDTRIAAEFVKAFLEEEGLDYATISPHPEMPNFVASFEGTAPGRHLVLNGHMDVFPVPDEAAWTHGPWSGAIADGHVWGRGAVDMKCGTTASIFAYLYLHRLRERLRGKLTLTVVSDEETFGPWGARYLIEHHPEIHGDCCLSGEPSDPRTVRFGEKGPLWLKFTIRTPGAHGSYTHLSANAVKIAARMIMDFEALSETPIALPEAVTAALDKASSAIEQAMGRGATGVIGKVTFSVGTIRGGAKVNMIASECGFEGDFRLPPGLEKETLMAEIRKVVARYPEATVEEINFSRPNWCAPDHAMVGIIQSNARALGNFEPQATVGLGGTDMRLWRYIGVPAYVYGPSPATMGRADERVLIEEFLHIVRTHALSAHDYLMSDRSDGR